MDHVDRRGLVSQSLVAVVGRAIQLVPGRRRLGGDIKVALPELSPAWKREPQAAQAQSPAQCRVYLPLLF